MRINHNMQAMNTQRQLNLGQTGGAKSMEKLSSGLRINRAGDDAAGLAISEKMRAQIRGLNQASRNSQDGISMIQTAEGALNETHAILQRMRELAVQASNDTNIATDRDEIQKEVNQLSTEVNRIAGTTEFNKQVLLDGTKSASRVTGASVEMTKAGTNAKQQSIEYVFTACINDANMNIAGCAACTVEFNGVTIFTQGCANAPACTTIAGSVAEMANLMNTALAGKFVATASGNKLTVTAVAGGACDGLATCTSGGFVGFAGCTSGELLVAGKQTKTVLSEGADAVTQVQRITFSNETVKEGLKITVGDKTVALWNSNSGTYANSTDAQQALGADALIDIYCADGSTVCAVDLVTSLQGCTASISCNSTLTICENQQTAKNTVLVVTSLAAGANSGAQSIVSLTSSEGSASGEGNGLTLQIGANTDQTFNVSFADMTAKGIKLTGQSAGSSVITSNNKTASFTTTATVGKNGATTEYALDVSSAEKATAAISAIDDSIQAVSAERSKLGAYQNRLEHTIKNLDTSSENLQASESRIRDVDMAKEMMEFTKNNILSQAAQAMLAQANQAPQGVLQLLR